MVDITELEEGDKIQHKETGDEKHVAGFIMNFDGEKAKAKLGFKVDDGSTRVASVGKNRLEQDESDEWELVEDSEESEETEIATDGGVGETECVHCGATDEPENGVVVGLVGESNETVCNICRTEFLIDNTVLSRRESEVTALKEQGMTHEKIAELIELDKSTVDEYSRRMKQKVQKAKTTGNELERFA